MHGIDGPNPDRGHDDMSEESLFGKASVILENRKIQFAMASVSMIIAIAAVGWMFWPRSPTEKATAKKPDTKSSKDPLAPIPSDTANRSESGTGASSSFAARIASSSVGDVDSATANTTDSGFNPATGTPNPPTYLSYDPSASGSSFSAPATTTDPNATTDPPTSISFSDNGNSSSRDAEISVSAENAAVPSPGGSFAIESSGTSIGSTGSFGGISANGNGVGFSGQPSDAAHDPNVIALDPASGNPGVYSPAPPTVPVYPPTKAGDPSTGPLIASNSSDDSSTEIELAPPVSNLVASNPNQFGASSSIGDRSNTTVLNSSNGGRSNALSVSPYAADNPGNNISSNPPYGTRSVPGQFLPSNPSELGTNPQSNANRLVDLPSSSLLPQATTGVVDRPGPRNLEGIQKPAISLQKIGPKEIQVNRPATFKLFVRNTGPASIQGIVVRDRVPQGTRLIATTPNASLSADGGLQWHLESLAPGSETVLSLEVLPLQEGEIGSVATVSFSAAATARTVCTRPILKLSLNGPRTVLIGESITLDVVVTNNGTGAADGVILEEDVPKIFSHPKGRKLEYEIGTLAPGETKRLSLKLRAEKAGIGVNQLHVRGEGNLADNQDLNIQVTAPQLAIGIEGPKLRFLERKAEYRIQVGNLGTSTAKDVALTLQLPKGIKFIETNNEGKYDPQTHTVRWSVAELPPQQQGDVRLVTLPVETGDQLLRVEATARLSSPALQEHSVHVESHSELTFSIADTADPIEIGSETVYEIQIQNQGSRPDTNIQLQVSFPDSIQPLDADGASRATSSQAGRVDFATVEKLNPGQKLTYRIRTRGNQQGSHLIRASVTSDQAGVPVTKEEQTRVYIDR